MKRIFILLTVLALIASFFIFVSVPGRGKGKMSNEMYTRVQFENYQNPVEQQTPGGAMQPDHDLWVINTTNACWDADDNYTWMAIGYLDAGASFSVTKQVITDWRDHIVGVKAFATKNDDYKVTISFDIPSKTWEYYPTLDGRDLRLKTLVLTPDYDNGSDKLSEIEGSNGGIGQLMTVTWTITNLKNKRSNLAWQGIICCNHSSHWVSWSDAPYLDGTCEGYDPRVCWSN